MDNKIKKNNIIISLPQKGEMTIQFWCNQECKRVNNILSLIEKEFNVSMNEHSELRSYILDTSNHIKRLLSYIEDNEGDN